MSDAPKSTVTIKKYANRRLYNTSTSSYVTLDDLAKMVKEGIEFNVYDAKTSEDITRPVLTQIIVEEEGKTEQTLLPIGFLRQLIGFYGDNMQWLVPKYLEHSMQSLSKNQEQLRTYFQSTFGSMFPFGSTLEEMGKQNLAMFERAMKMFSPFGVTGMPTMANTPANTAEAALKATSTMMEEQEAAAEAAFTPSSSMSSNVMPMASTAQATSQSSISGADVQDKIAALQKQLSDLAKK